MTDSTTRGSHSPGPWFAEKLTFDPLGHSNFPWRIYNELRGGRNGIVPEVWGRNDAERQANARLIAAAPAMYEALKIAINELREVSEAFHLNSYDILGAQLEAALAKAEGRP